MRQEEKAPEIRPKRLSQESSKDCAPAPMARRTSTTDFFNALEKQNLMSNNLVRRNAL